jgi:cytochrome c oxidase subunit III
MSTVAAAINQPPETWHTPYKGRVAMYSLIIAESSMFTIFVVAYLYYLGKSLSGPTPREVLHLPIFNTVCLLSSSITIHFAVRFLRRGATAGFLALWFLTIILGGIFLVGTGVEWHTLIYKDGLTVSTNLFGTTFYSLVGLHAFHVTVGLIMLLTVLLFGLAGKVQSDQTERLDVLSMYWHFVDAVWVVVFSVVYIVGR